MGRQLGIAARAVTTTHRNLTSSWTEDVETLETAIRQFPAHGPLKNDCQVVFFEVDGDHQLHVNVTHRHQTVDVRGWSGPGKLPDGFVHNRRFDHAPPSRIVEHIREMVFAGRDR